MLNLIMIELPIFEPRTFFSLKLCIIVVRDFSANNTCLIQDYGVFFAGVQD